MIEDGNPDKVLGIAHNLSLARLLMAEGPDGPDRARRSETP